jgi:hypothetical protein
MELLHQRVKLRPERTTGKLLIDGQRFCYVVEDPVREVPGQPVAEWKVHGATAIPVGRYRCTLARSPRFGPDTITLHDVPGFVGIRVHSGNNEDHTEGCPLVGYGVTPDGTIAFGTTKPALADLKSTIRNALARHEEVWWEVRNPDGYTGPKEVA